MSTVTGVFTTRFDAEQAISQLETLGVTQDQISLVLTDEARGEHFGLKKGSKVEEGVTVGGTTVGLLGAILGGIAAAGAIAIPGLNLVATGTLISALSGLGAGALTGGLVGGLIGSGIPEHEAKLYENEVKAGNVLVAVKTDSSEQTSQVKKIFNTLEKNRAVA